MFFQSKLADFFARMGAGLVIGLMFGWLLSEMSFWFLPDRETITRAPQRVELVIPYGTAERVKEGAVVGSILNDLVLVQGDILVVKNEDVVAHNLGPLFVPSNTSGVLEMNAANDYTYECSFRPDKYIGLEVRPRLEGGVRFQGILSVGLPSGMMLFVYTYLMNWKAPWLRKEEKNVFVKPTI
jgi:hypothetical protein